MRSRTSSFSTAALQQGSSFICTAHLFTTADHRTHFLSSRHGAAATQQMTEQISPASFFFFIFKGSSLSPYDSRYIWTTLVVLCVKATPSPTIAAAAGDQDVRRRGLSWAWAEGVQAVERVLAAVAWRGERVAALRVPAVDVAAVPDAAFRALCLLRLLNMVNTCTGHIKCTNSCGKRKTLNISCKEHW